MADLTTASIVLTDHKTLLGIFVRAIRAVRDLVTGASQRNTLTRTALELIRPTGERLERGNVRNIAEI